MARSALIESELWLRHPVERQISHQERNSVWEAYIHKPEYLEERNSCCNGGLTIWKPVG